MPDPAPHALLVLTGRSPLAFHPLHREPLLVHPLRALAEAAGPVVVSADAADVARVRADVRRRRLAAEVVEGEAWWEVVRRETGRGLLVHDALCPLVDAGFVGDLVARAADRPETSFVAVRTVTDTLKAVVDGRIEGTIDRSTVATVTSPVLLSPTVMEGLDDPPPVSDFSRLVAWLRERGEVELVRAPSLARRIDDAGSLRLLESLDEVGHRVRATRR